MRETEKERIEERGREREPERERGERERRVERARKIKEGGREPDKEEEEIYLQQRGEGCVYAER